jgi:hypothetical protein
MQKEGLLGNQKPWRWRRNDEEHNAHRMKQAKQLALVVLVVILILGTNSLETAKAQFGTALNTAQSSNVITLSIQQPSTDAIEITLNTAGTYNVTGHACVVGDAVFINGSPLVCLGAGNTDCHTVIIAAIAFSVFQLTGSLTSIQPRACDVGGGYGILLELVPL